MVKIALQSSEETRWIALLLGTGAGVVSQVDEAGDQQPTNT